MNEQLNREQSDQIEIKVRDQIREILITDSSRERGKKLSQLISIIASTGTDFNEWVRSIRRKDILALLPPLAEALSVQEVPRGKPLIKSIFQRLSGHSAIGLFVKKEDQKHGILVPIDVMAVPGEGRDIVIPQAHILAQAMPAIRTSAFNWIDSFGWFGLYDKAEYDIYVHLGEPINTPPFNGALDGPSLGLLIGIVIACHFCDLTLPSTTSATGELSAGGGVNPVEGVFAKVKAAIEEGKITPVFTPRLTDEERAELGDYLSSVQEVGSLEEAINVLFRPSYPKWYIDKHRNILKERKIDANKINERKVRVIR